MKPFLFNALAITTCTVLLFSCMAKKNTARTETNTTKVDTITLHKPLDGYANIPVDIDYYQKKISGLKQKYGHLRVYPIHPPEQYGDAYFTQAMERFKALLPDYFYKENPRLYSGMNNPKLTTAGDFKKCTFILVPVYKVIANAFEFTDLTTQKATDFLNLYTEGCLVLIKKGREIIEVSGLFLKPAQSNIGCLSHETEGKVETIRYFNEARQKSEKVFAITGPGGGIGYPMLGFLDKSNKAWIMKNIGNFWHYNNKGSRVNSSKRYYEILDPNYGLKSGQYLSVYLQIGLPELELNRQGK